MAKQPPDPRTINIPLVNRRLAAVLAAAGGEAGVRAMVREFYQRMAADVMLMHFFDGRDVDAIAGKQTEFLLRAMGARESYSGKPPASAHDALPDILEGHFNRRLTILRQTLLDHGLSEADADAWVSFENAFRDAVVKA